MKSDPPPKRIQLHGIPIPIEDLQRGTLILGAPGSGKTASILLPLVAEIIQAYGNGTDKPAIIVLEAKPNDLGPRLRDMLVAVGRQLDYQELRPGLSVYNPLASPFLSSDTTACEQLLQAGHQVNQNNTPPQPDEAYWHQTRQGLLTTILTIARLSHPANTLTFQRIEQVKNVVLNLTSPDKLRAWLNHPAQRPLPESVRQYLKRHVALPENTRACIDVSVEACLKPFFAPEALTLTTPQSDLELIDPAEILQDGRCLILSTTSPHTFGPGLLAINYLFLEHLVQMVLARSVLKVMDPHGQVRPLNQSRKLLIVIDEAHHYLSASPSCFMARLLSEGRQYHAMTILATQSLSTLAHVSSPLAAERIAGCCDNAFFMSTTDVMTANRASGLFQVEGITPSITASELPPPLLFPTKPYPSRPSQPRGIAGQVSLASLARLKTGEFYARIANGKTYRKQAKLVDEAPLQ